MYTINNRANIQFGPVATPENTTEEDDKQECADSVIRFTRSRDHQQRCNAIRVSLLLGEQRFDFVFVHFPYRSLQDVWERRY
jgi:hypothetical protein